MFYAVFLLLAKYIVIPASKRIPPKNAILKMFVAVLARLSPFPVSAAPVSPLSGVGVEGVGVSPFVGGVGFGSSFSETISIATLQSSSIVTVPTTFPSASVTVYSPFGNSSRSTIAFPSLSVVIVTVVLPSFDVNVYVLSLDGLPSSVTVISTSSHTFGSSFGSSFESSSGSVGISITPASQVG